MIQLSLSKLKQKESSPQSKFQEPKRSSIRPKAGLSEMYKFSEREPTNQKKIGEQKKSSSQRDKQHICRNHTQDELLRNIKYSINNYNIQQEDIDVGLPRMNTCERVQQISIKKDEGRSCRHQKLLGYKGKVRIKKQRKMKNEGSNSPSRVKRCLESHSLASQIRSNFKEIQSLEMFERQSEEEYSIGPWEQNGRSTRFPFIKTQKGSHQKKQSPVKGNIRLQRKIIQINSEFLLNRSKTNRNARSPIPEKKNSVKRNLFRPPERSKTLQNQPEKMETPKKTQIKKKRDEEDRGINKKNAVAQRERSQTSTAAYVHEKAPTKSSIKKKQVIIPNEQKYSHFNFLRSPAKQKQVQIAPEAYDDKKLKTFMQKWNFQYGEKQTAKEKRKEYLTSVSVPVNLL